MVATTERKVPARAMAFAAELQLQPAGDSPTTIRTGKIVARTEGPAYHWYWGRCVHDLAGMQVPKPRVPLDYCHDCGDVVGFAENFDAAGGPLECAASLVTHRPEDRAAKLMADADAGVGVEVVVQRQADLLEVVAALRPAGGFPRLLDSGEQECNQNRDDRDDHLEFDQSKPRSMERLRPAHGYVPTASARIRNPRICRTCIRRAGQPNCRETYGFEMQRLGTSRFWRASNQFAEEQFAGTTKSSPALSAFPRSGRHIRAL